MTVRPNPEILLNFNVIKADTNKVINDKIITHGLDIPISLSFEVKSLNIKWKGEFFEQDPKFYKDLYNIAFREGSYNSDEERFKTYFKDDTYYIRQECADGGGFYWVVWVIRNSKIMQRLVVDLT